MFCLDLLIFWKRAVAQLFGIGRYSSLMVESHWISYDCCPCSAALHLPIHVHALVFTQLPYTTGFSFDFFGTKEGVLTAISCSFSLVAWTGAAVLGRFRSFLVHLKKTHICTHLCINTLRIHLHIHIYAKFVVFVSLFPYISANMNIRYYIPRFNLLLRTCQGKWS